MICLILPLSLCLIPKGWILLHLISLGDSVLWNSISHSRVNVWTSPWEVHVAPWGQFETGSDGAHIGDGLKLLLLTKTSGI
jgi:hypothetical protein